MSTSGAVPATRKTQALASAKATPSARQTAPTIAVSSASGFVCRILDEMRASSHYADLMDAYATRGFRGKPMKPGGIGWLGDQTLYSWMSVNGTGGREVVVTTAGNITTSDGNNVSLDELYKFLLLIYDGNRSKWNVVGGGGSGSGTYYQTIRDAGTPLTQRGKLNFIEGTNVTLTITDDAGNDETEITIAASAGGAGAPGMNIYRWQQFN
jgi:hypothetical protein